MLPVKDTHFYITYKDKTFQKKNVIKKAYK